MPLLNDSIMDTLCTLDRDFVMLLQLERNFFEVRSHIRQFHLFSLSLQTTIVDQFIGKTTIWVYTSTSTPSDPSIFTRPRVQLQLPPPSPMQIDPSTTRSLVPLPVSTPLVQADRNELMEPFPTARNSRRLLQKRINRLMIKPESITMFPKCVYLFSTFSPIFPIYIK